MRKQSLEAPGEKTAGLAEDLSSVPESCFEPGWERLIEHGFATLTDTALGLPTSVRSYLAKHYFTENVLARDHTAVHQDRDRARDVIRYRWRDDGTVLTEHDDIAIVDRSGVPGVRIPKRVHLTADPVTAYWIRVALSLVPPIWRRVEGTFGANLLRTRTDVVSQPHHDDEEFVLVYVVDKQGGGATTTLHPVDGSREVAFRETLAPGTSLIFRDADFLHDVTPLQGLGSQSARRDALVCTVDYPGAYSER